jgi:hypothetical protein
MNTFLENLAAGFFDPQSGDLHQPPPAKSVTIKKEEAGDDQEAFPDHDALAPVDESMKVDEDVAIEVEEDGDKLDANGKGLENGRRDSRDRGEEVSVAPEGHQVMIRTIPPDIGRVKLETVGVRILCCGFQNNILLGLPQALDTIPGFIYLALGDPLQKRNFYRAGWLKFHEDADINVIMSELSERKAS